MIALLALIIALVPVSESELQKLRGDLKEIHSKLELLIKNSGISKRKDFYTIAECADYISQKKRHVENLVSSREIKVHRSGRSVRIRHEDLERYLTKNRG